MSDMTALLISQDPSLDGLIGELVSSIRHLRLERIEGYEEACVRVEGGGVALVLSHLDFRSPVAGLTRLLGVIITSGQKIPVLVLTDEYQAEKGVAAASPRRPRIPEPAPRPEPAQLPDGRPDDRGPLRPPEASGAGTDPGAVSLAWTGDPPFLFLPEGHLGRTIEQIERIAPLETTILLGGETGTGKTHLASAIHRLSPRRDKPFLTINCGALAASLIESEMFGHVKGAYTGADADRTGKFAAVGRGTLFLDEIDTLTPELQAKLLRVVEERALRAGRVEQDAAVAGPADRGQQPSARAGGGRRPVPGRPVLPAQRGRLRPAPPARANGPHPGHRHDPARRARRPERQPDLRNLPRRHAALLAYSWPGNIRELRNVLERAVAFSRGPVIAVEDLPDQLHRPGSPRRSRLRGRRSSGDCRSRAQHPDRCHGSGPLHPGQDQGPGRARHDPSSPRAQRQQPPPRRRRPGHQPHDPLQEAAQVRPDGGLNRTSLLG